MKVDRRLSTASASKVRLDFVSDGRAMTKPLAACFA